MDRKEKVVVLGNGLFDSMGNEATASNTVLLEV